MKLFDADTTCDELRRVYPPSVLLVQREGCPWSYAHSKKAKVSLQCFDKLKFDARKKPPKSKRDVEQKLVPRVKAWREKWMEHTNSRHKRHLFATEEVSHYTLTLPVTLTRNPNPNPNLNPNPGPESHPRNPYPRPSLS